MNGIVTSSGSELDLNQFNPLIGYQIEHKITGRILPSTTHFQIFKKTAALLRLMEVKEVYNNINMFEYELVPIYESEIETGWILIEHKLDQLKGM